MWKLHGKRLDGLTNDDLPSLAVRGDPKSLHLGGKRVEKVDYDDAQKLGYHIRDAMVDIDFTGTAMPPPEAVEGTYKGPDGRPIKVPALTDEERRTFARWIDLGCPIDVDPNYDPSKGRSYGWMGDDQRPTLAVTLPSPERILIGMADAYTGLDLAQFRVTADVAVDGTDAGKDFAPRFTALDGNRWELKLSRPLASGTLTVSVKDLQGNVSTVRRTIPGR